MSILSRILSNLFSRPPNRAEEDRLVTIAAHDARQIMELHNVPKGQKGQFGDFTIMLGNSEDPTNTASRIEIDYMEKRVLNRTFVGYENSPNGGWHNEMSRDLSWTRGLHYEYLLSQHLYSAEKPKKAEERYLP